MTPEHLAALEAEADNILVERHAPRTPSLDAFIDSLEFDAQEAPTAVSIHRALDTAPLNPPLDFATVTAIHFMTWIMSMKTADDEFLAAATYKNHRSAFGYLFATYNVSMQPEVKDAIGKRINAMSKKIARQISGGVGEIKVGKDPLPFSLYRRISLEMQRSTSRDMVFARTFMILSWNLMSRAANTVSICYKRMQWGEDALSIYFAHMKNDQTGSRPRDPRHLYANPLMPEVCPILALGVYWATYGIDHDDGYLFPGSNQRGINPTDFGTHSLRNGAATYSSSGSTACPSAIAIHLRAGWAMGGVTDRYLRHAAAGYMHVGRTVCGLPTETPEFATLPPRFIGARAVVCQTRTLCFPSLPPCAVGVGEFALASLALHLPYLRQQNPSHPVFENVLLSNQVLVDQLVAVLATAEATDIAPTGVPPHVALLLEMRGVPNALQRQQEAHAAAIASRELADAVSVERIVRGVTSVLDERAVASGIPTCERLAATVVQYFRDAGYIRDENPQSQQTQAAEAAEASSVEEQNDGDAEVQRTVYAWGGGFHFFPEGTALPSGTPEQAWVLWCCGDSTKNIAPLSLLEPPDLCVQAQRKRLPDFKFLMKRIKSRADALGLPTENVSVTDALTTYAACADAIALSSTTQHGRKRRRGQLVWITVATQLRKAARCTNNTPGSSNFTPHQ